MRFILSQILLVVLVCLSFQGSAEAWKKDKGKGDTECRYWCKTPEDKSYCCEESNGKPDKPELHKGECPPTRAVCPKSSGGSPKNCSSDGSCGRKEKCCFDRCIEHHICKPAENRRG